MIDKSYVIAKNNIFKKALESLRLAVQEPFVDDLQRDGAIQRFEYCFELGWKLVKTVVDYEGYDITGSPREVLAMGARLKILDDEIDWFRMLLERNNSTHTYKEDLANEIAGNLPLNLEVMQKLVDRISKRYQ